MGEHCRLLFSGTIEGGNEIPATPVWFGPTERPLFGWCHLPADGRARGAVVICASIGRDHLQSHYALRRLAVGLEEAGFCVLRFDYDGTGDSAGASSDPGRVEAWLDSTSQAMALVRKAGASRLVLVGIRLGATLAAEAARRDGAVDELVLWDPPPSVRTFLSQQRALAALSFGISATLPEGSVETPGLVYDAETVHHLRQIDIGSAPGPWAQRITVLTRPGGDDRRLREALGSSAVEWEEATGQAELIDAESPFQVLPDTAINRIVAGLDRRAATERAVMDPPQPAGTAVIGTAGATETVLERPAFLGPLGLFAIVAEPAGDVVGPTVAFLTVAKDHHIGPNRLWVELSRRLARRGLRAVRVDLSGLGDSPVRDGQPEYVARSPWAFNDVDDLARALSPDDPSDVVLVGLCSAAYQALESAFELRPRGIVAINPVLSFQPPEVLAGGSLDPRRRIALPRGTVVQAFHHTGPLSPLRRRFPNLGWRLRILMAPGRRPSIWLKELVAAGVDLFFVCGEREARPIRHGSSTRTLGRLAATGHFTFEFIPGLDHGLQRSDNREAASEMVVRYLLDRYGPALDARMRPAPLQQP